MRLEKKIQYVTKVPSTSATALHQPEHTLHGHEHDEPGGRQKRLSDDDVRARPCDPVVTQQLCKFAIPGEWHGPCVLMYESRLSDGRVRHI